MTVALVIVALLLGLAVGLLGPHIRRRPHYTPQLARTRHILLPFTTTTLSRRALEAAIRLARAEDATLMPAFLATVPLTLPLESPLPGQSLAGMPLLEAIEQRAIASGIAVDSRVQAGRTYRHALARLLQGEQFDRVIISAIENLRSGLSGPDLLWLLTHTTAEVMILRPAPQDTHIISADELHGHF
ncbi:MAG TPA: universal stress protein [Solirubrobacteraceae bacterium]